MLSRFSRTSCAMALAACACSAGAQSIDDTVRAANLGTGYAQMLNLATTPALSAASYDVGHGDPRTSIDVTRLPWQGKLATLAPGVDVSWRVAASYLRIKDSLHFELASLPAGVDTRWTAYGASAGLVASIALAPGWSVEPGLDVAVTRLENSASYSGAAEPLRPVLDNRLFNWTTDAWLATPGVALQWQEASPERRMRVRGSLAWSWISSFSESSDVLAFREQAGVYAVRGEYAAPTGLSFMQRPLDWVAVAGYSGFFGANRDALGFSAVAEVGLGLEAPWIAGKPDNNVRISGSYLFGPSVRGWTVGVGLAF